jgi:hypothetical protein
MDQSGHMPAGEATGRFADRRGASPPEALETSGCSAVLLRPDHLVQQVSCPATRAGPRRGRRVCNRPARPAPCATGADQDGTKLAVGDGLSAYRAQPKDSPFVIAYPIPMRQLVPCNLRTHAPSWQPPDFPTIPGGPCLPRRHQSVHSGAAMHQKRAAHPASVSLTLARAGKFSRRITAARLPAPTAAGRAQGWFDCCMDVTHTTRFREPDVHTRCHSSQNRIPV